MTQQPSSLSIEYENNSEAHEQVRQTDHVVKRMSKAAGNAKEIITHTLRARWVMVDKEAFEALLEDLHSLTYPLHVVFGNDRERQIHEITAKTYREIIILRNNIGELKAMFDAVISLLKLSDHGSTQRNHDTF